MYTDPMYTDPMYTPRLAPTATHSWVTTTAVCVLFMIFVPSFRFLEMSLFPSFICTITVFIFVYGENVVRFFLPDDVFLPCDHGLDF